MPFLSINSATNIYYELTGQGEPIVLIAGHRGDYSSWNFIAPVLSHNFKVLVFDNLASGKTTDDEKPLSIEVMADTAWRLISKLNLKKPTIIGESMGGAISQMIARKYGKKLDKLVIINSMMKVNAATLMNLEAQIELRKLDIPFDLSLKLRLPWVFSSKFLSSEGNVTSFRERLLGNPYLLSIENQTRQLEAMKGFDSRNWAGDIQVPTLIISAKDDIVVLPSEVAELAKTIPNAKLTSVTGGHGSPFEAPSEITEAIVAFLQES